MDKIEKKLREYAIYDPIKVREAPIQEILEGLDYEKISGGQMGRVFKIKDKDWIMKEGRWDLSLELFWDKKLPLPAEITERVLKLFAFTFLPREEEVLRQYRMYLNFIEYFGYFESEKDYFHPNISIIQTAQRTIRDSLTYFKPRLEKQYNMKFNGKIDEILESDDIKYHNFLPKEFLLYGRSISKANKNKLTQFIFQDYIEGDLLHDKSNDELSQKELKQLILMIYLLLLMHYQLGIIPDTRPRYIFTEAYNWLTKTDNIIISKEGLKFIDTRWFWDSKSNLVRRGVIIPNMIINMSKLYLSNLLKHVE